MPKDKIACGEYHSAIVTTDGSAKFFGSNKIGNCKVLEGFEDAHVLAVACGPNKSALVQTDGQA